MYFTAFIHLDTVLPNLVTVLSHLANSQGAGLSAPVTCKLVQQVPRTAQSLSALITQQTVPWAPIPLQSQTASPQSEGLVTALSLARREESRVGGTQIKYIWGGMSELYLKKKVLASVSVLCEEELENFLCYLKVFCQPGSLKWEYKCPRVHCLCTN